MPFFVSRQCYWGADPDECWVVEIAVGGLDYANPDMLCARYVGEGKEYADPREAVEAALEIAASWRKAEPDKVISVARGCTGGFTMPFEPEQDDEKLRQWAEEVYAKLPKCDQCGELLPEEYLQDEFEEFKFCREYCAETWQGAP